MNGYENLHAIVREITLEVFRSVDCVQCQELIVGHVKVAKSEVLRHFSPPGHLVEVIKGD
jgi:hypothetical protein